MIAEIGVNHNGQVELAKEMIRVAQQCGADMVKFQTFVPEAVVAGYAEKADYQKRLTGGQESQLAMLKRMSLPLREFAALQKVCQECGVAFLSTAFDQESLDVLRDLDMDFWKVASGEITNLPFLEAVAATGKPIVLSTGMSDAAEIAAALQVLRRHGNDDITLLHCTSEYPASFAEINLQAIRTLQQTFALPVGYSDHTEGCEAAIAAVALGACLIEKHFTLDKNMAGPDHRASLEPHEFADMVRAVRNIEQAMGDGVKRPSAAEEKNKLSARKSIVAKANIRRGEEFTEQNLTVKRPGTGMSPMEWYTVLGQTAKRDFDQDELVEV